MCSINCLQSTVYSKEANFGPSLKSFTSDVKSIELEIEGVIHLNVL